VYSKNKEVCYKKKHKKHSLEYFSRF